MRALTRVLFSFGKVFAIFAEFAEMPSGRFFANNEDGLESAKPDLQSAFKKPGGATAEPRPWGMLRDGRAEGGLKRREWGRQTARTDGRGRAHGDGLTSRR